MNADKFTFLAWDPPGYGKSRPPDRDVFTVENPLIKDAHLARALMKKLGYDKYSVVGHSGGGMTGVFLAAAYPNDVQKLVICNTRLKTDARMVQIFRYLKVWAQPQLEALLQDYDKPYAVKMLKDYAKLTEQNSRSDDAKRFYLTQLKKILAPTLYIKSMKDGLVPIEDVYAYGNYIRNFRVQKVAKGGHSHLDFLDDFVTATENFLSEK